MNGGSVRRFVWSQRGSDGSWQLQSAPCPSDTRFTSPSIRPGSGSSRCISPLLIISCESGAAMQSGRLIRSVSRDELRPAVTSPPLLCHMSKLPEFLTAAVGFLRPSSHFLSITRPSNFQALAPLNPRSGMFGSRDCRGPPTGSEFQMLKQVDSEKTWFGSAAVKDTTSKLIKLVHVTYTHPIRSRSQLSIMMTHPLLDRD